MAMDHRLAQLQRLTFEQAKVKEEFLDTLQASDPMQAFCDVAAKYGQILMKGELATLGEESCAAMLRSQNGGGEIEPVGWDDDYALFFLNLGAKL